MQDSIAKRADLDSTLDFPRGSYKCQKLSVKHFLYFKKSIYPLL